VEIAERGRPLGTPLSVWFHFRLVPFLAAHLVKLLLSTLRVSRDGFEAVQELVDRDQRFIYAFWHRRLAMGSLAYPFSREDRNGERRGVAILSSDSKDGERSAATWRWLGIHAVRGTAGDKGAQALVKMIRVVKAGWDLAITVDGPRGPRQKVKPGVMAVSRKTGAWVVPLSAEYGNAWTLHTWDEMLLPKPFSRCTVRFGQPFQVLPEQKDDEALGARLEEILNLMETPSEDPRLA
jgi:lysophospholipid acyltransferase (LPLAT)-like uncharacterized protein